MILIHDSFLEPQQFKNLQDYCKQPFVIQKVGDKEFSVLETPHELIPLLQMDGYNLILTFIRSAYKGFDETPRIHCDHYIEGQKASMAAVLYINNQGEVTPNGTAFYTHIDLGLKAPEDLSTEEFDRLILEDSNDLDKWTENDRISSVPNRLLVYDANYWHSKWPFRIDHGTRFVLVAFYSKIT